MEDNGIVSRYCYHVDGSEETVGLNSYMSWLISVPGMIINTKKHLDSNNVEYKKPSENMIRYQFIPNN